MKQKQVLVVVDDSDMAIDLQPDKDITNTQKMVAWCKENLKAPGEYRLIRKVPGTIVVESKQTVSVKLV